MANSNSKKVADIRRRRKEFLVELLGGECHRCGYGECNAALQFHHADRDKKLFSIGASGNTNSIEIQTEEVLKCWLLCANCHKQIDYCVSEGDDFYHSHEIVTKFHDQNDTITKAGLEVKKVQAIKQDNLELGRRPRNTSALVKTAKIKEVKRVCDNKECKAPLSRRSNKTTWKNTNLCGKCYMATTAKIAWPCSCILSEKLKTTTYISLARELGVSDNGIRRRLKAHPDCIC